MPVPFLHALQATFATHADRPALAFADTTYTYGRLAQKAQAVAKLLQERGVAKGDRVVLCTGDKHAFLLGHVGALWAGAVSLPLNPRFTREELKFFLGDSGAVAALVGAETAPSVASLRSELPALRAVFSDRDVLEAPDATVTVPPISGDDPCFILYSSGTTGWPKGVVHTHANVASGLGGLQRCWRMVPEDIVLNVLPLFHIHGLCFASQLTLFTGACLIVDEFQAERTLEQIGRASVFMAVPTIYYRFLEHPGFRAAAKAWRGVRLFTCGSAPIRAEVLPELESILGSHVINRYGMTEGFVITSLPLDGPWPHGSVGKALDGVEVRVMVDDRPAAPGEVGAVQLRGPNLFREYWNKPEATQSAFASGWFDTGDLGSLDAAGFLTLVGRKNDLIITSGYNVYPQVVERILNECPGVKESAVLGIADAHKGERVAAAVVRSDPSLDEAALQAFLAERLVDYQRPRQIVFMDALPRNALGKVLRREIQERLQNEGSQ
jgi:malonyl-CoA/methylmalonyl-CoA synthetase